MDSETRTSIITKAISESVLRGISARPHQIIGKIIAGLDINPGLYDEMTVTARNDSGRDMWAFIIKIIWIRHFEIQDYVRALEEKLDRGIQEAIISCQP